MISEQAIGRYSKQTDTWHWQTTRLGCYLVRRRVLMCLRLVIFKISQMIQIKNINQTTNESFQSMALNKKQGWIKTMRLFELVDEINKKLTQEVSDSEWLASGKQTNAFSTADAKQTLAVENIIHASYLSDDNILASYDRKIEKIRKDEKLKKIQKDLENKMLRRQQLEALLAQLQVHQQAEAKLSLDKMEKIVFDRTKAK